MTLKIKRNKAGSGFGAPSVEQALSAAIERHKAGRLREAEQAYRRVLEVQPSNAVALHYLGVMAVQANDPATAVRLIRKSVEQAPHYKEAHYNLGVAYHQLDRLAEAADCYRRTLALEPDHPLALNNLGAALTWQGGLEEALSCIERSIAVNAANAEAHNNMGVVMGLLGRRAEGADCFRRALAINPSHLEARRHLATYHKDEGRYREAIENFRMALSLDPRNVMIQLSMESVCPVIIPEGDFIDPWREGFMSRLEKYGPINLRPRDLRSCPPAPSFYLPYQGRDDLRLKRKFAGLFVNSHGAAPPARRRERKRIGFLVTSGHEGIFLKIMRGVLENWQDSGSALTVICDSVGAESIRRRVSNPEVDYLIMPTDFQQVVDTISSAEFDLICYWEVGTDLRNYFLPFFRPAPVQCTSWGAVETTGVPNMDYFISSGLFEPGGAESHYSEKLVRLNGLPGYFYRPNMPSEMKGREHFGLSQGDNIYICPQNLAKFHPDFDRILGEILLRDPGGRLVLVEGKYGHWGELLRERLGRSIPEAIDRVVFMPRQSYEDYFSLIHVSDVMLDTFHFGGGCTTLEGLAAGVPIVTLPGRFMRGRAAYGCYRKMGVMDCVASSPEHYVEIAVRLGTDPLYRDEVRRRIAARSQVLFGDMSTVREFEEFFSAAIEKSWAEREALAGASLARCRKSLSSAASGGASAAIPRGRPAPKGIIAVTGMHRSGTSCTAGLLEKCGYSLGTSHGLLADNRAMSSNQKGHFENLAVVSLNEKILAQAGGSWCCPPPAAEIERAGKDLAGQMERFSREFNGRVIKDPRLSLTLPLWLKHCPGIDCVVVCVRNPLSVAGSLRKRDGFALNAGLWLWFQYNARLLEALGDRVLFNVGEAGIKEDAAPALSAIAAVIAGIPNDIAIEGHTDNVPISNSRYSSNWELSTARAASVLEFLVRDRGLSPSRFSVSGYAEFRPVAPNETPEGRARNRRVDIVILGRQ